MELVLSSCQDPEFVDFVKKFMIWSPEERITAQEAILEPWILKGLP